MTEHEEGLTGLRARMLAALPSKGSALADMDTDREQVTDTKYHERASDEELDISPPEMQMDSHHSLRV